MVVVFAAFALAEVITIKSIGVGMAIAVAVDATIIRVLLVPATMRLMGRWNWWAPGILGRLADRLGFSHVEDDDPVDEAGTRPTDSPVQTEGLPGATDRRLSFGGCACSSTRPSSPTTVERLRALSPDARGRRRQRRRRVRRRRAGRPGRRGHRRAARPGRPRRGCRRCAGSRSVGRGRPPRRRSAVAARASWSPTPGRLCASRSAST